MFEDFFDVVGHEQGDSARGVVQTDTATVYASDTP